MKKYSILMVDLAEGVQEQNKAAFYVELRMRKWMRIDDTATLWYAHWDKGVMDGATIVAITKKDVAEAARIAQIDHYDASVAVCGRPTGWRT